MKKTKLLLATPIILAPVITALPLMVSCNKQGDISVGGDITQYADVEVLSGKLVVDEPYIIQFSIKKEQIGKKFLPNTLTKVTSGGITLDPLDGSTSNVPHYYIYLPSDNNTVATLTIGRAQGPVTVEATATELKSITAYGIDVSKEDCAEFEVGETLADDTSRVLVKANLSNDESFYLEDSYSITLQNGVKAGHIFVDTEKTSTPQIGTVKYLNKTANFKYNIIAKTQAYFFDEVQETVDKCTSIPDAIAKYESTAAGQYTISIADGKYQFTGDAPLTITQKANKYLSIGALNEPTFDGKWTKFSVTFDYTPTTTGQSCIKIVGDGNDTKNSSISISGINFLHPSLASDLSYNFISLDNSISNKQVHDVTISLCKFMGESSAPTTVNAISTPDSTANDPTLITIDSCIGYYLNALFNGSAYHDGTTATYTDLFINNILLVASNHLLEARGTGIRALIYDVSAGLMFDAEHTGANEGILLEAPGEYTFRNCLFEQLDESTTSDPSSYIHIKSEDTTASHKINLYGVDFINWEEKTKAINAVSLTTTSAAKWDIYWSYWTKTQEATIDKTNPTWNPSEE